MIIRKYYKVFINIWLIIFGLLVIFFINGFYERNIIDNQFSTFKERTEHYMSIGNTNYYIIKKENQYDFEDTTRNTYNMETHVVGSKSDIIIGNRNPLRNTFVSPIMEFLANKFFLGHTTMNTTDDGSRLIEVLGNRTPEKNIVGEAENLWMSDTRSALIVGLRIIDTSFEQRDQMVEYAKVQIGKRYNYTFLFNRVNSFYCTDLVSRASKAGGVNINYDYFTTTGTDIIMSKNTYIFFLREAYTEDGALRYNVYFLE